MKFQFGLWTLSLVRKFSNKFHLQAVDIKPVDKHNKFTSLTHTWKEKSYILGTLIYLGADDGNEIFTGFSKQDYSY